MSLDNELRATKARIDSNRSGKSCVAASLLEIGASLSRSTIPNLEDFERELPPDLYVDKGVPVLRFLEMAEVGAEKLGLEIERIELNPRFNLNVPPQQRVKIQKGGDVGFPSNSIVAFTRDGANAGHCVSTVNGAGHIGHYQRDNNLIDVATIKFKRRD